MIELICLDVDGTLTSGEIFYTNSLQEAKAFNVKDGLAITSWIRLGKKVAILTGRSSKIVDKRAQELGVHYIEQNCKDKLGSLKKICEKENLDLENVAAIGDDLNDLKMLKSVGRSFCPQDANELIKPFVQDVLPKASHQGAVATMIVDLVSQMGLKKEYIHLWL